MNLEIHPSTNCDREELRTLLIDAADQLMGSGGKLLEPKLPWDGNPILLSDAGHHPVLVSFDPQDSQQALLSGLRAVQMLSGALPWVNQVYDALQNEGLPPKLIVVSSEFPPGAEPILSTCTNLGLFKYKVLTINGDTGLLLEQSAPESHQQPPVTAATVPEPPKPTVVAVPAEKKELPKLSAEENAYFQQL